MIQNDFIFYRRSKAISLGFKFKSDGDIVTQLCPPGFAGIGDIVDANKIICIINCIVSKNLKEMKTLYL